MAQKREIKIQGETAIVPLTRGFVAVIDIQDIDKVAGFNWFAVVQKHGAYAVRRASKEESLSGKLSMHRAIMGNPDGVQIDHIDLDGTNNRRGNLRVASVLDNSYNRRKNSKNTSGYKGVCWNKAIGKWQAQIRANKIRKYLGLFDTPEMAYAAYCNAAMQYHGEFARVT